MHAKGRTGAWLAGISAWFLLLAFLLSGVYFLTHAYGFFEKEYAKYDAASDIGVSDETLMEITAVVLDYLNDRRESLDMQAEINGELTEVFTEREKDHMVDVLVLIRLGRWALASSALIGAALLSLAIVTAARNRTGKCMCIGYVIGAGSFLLVGAVIALCFALDFTRAFYVFHTIFFSNDLWMLPSDAVMIKMVPEAFFFDCALLLAGFFVGGLLLTCIPAFVLTLCLKNPNSEEKAHIEARQGSDGYSYFEIQGSSPERPKADEIFQRLGLRDEDENTDEKDEVPYSFLNAPKKAADAKGIGTSLTLEMKLDLRILQTENGLELVPDPEKPLDIHVTAKKGELNMLVQALEKENEPLRLSISSAKAGEENTELPRKTEESAAAFAMEEERETIPSVEELLGRMNDMMRGYPKEKYEGDEK